MSLLHNSFIGVMRQLQGAEYEQEFLKLMNILYNYQLENIRVLEGLLDSSLNNSPSDLRDYWWN